MNICNTRYVKVLQTEDDTRWKRGSTQRNEEGWKWIWHYGLNLLNIQKRGGSFEKLKTHCAPEQQLGPPAASTMHLAHTITDGQETPTQKKEYKHRLEVWQTIPCESQPSVYVENPK